jgi:DNA repair exonuclease SbcCD ATPase subunit
MKNLFSLESVRLVNYKYHIDTTIPFTEGLNLITGETSVGKSCAFDGLLWIYGFSNIAKNDYRREGTESTSVIIKLSSGFEVERVRTNTVNRYILRKDGCDDKIFDSIDKDVPEEIRQVLGIEELTFDNTTLNINFASQDDLNFLFDSKIPASFNAKLFNRLAGNSILDSLFAVCNKEKLSINKNIESLNEQIVKQKEDVENCTKQYSELNAKLQKVQELYSSIEEQIIIYDELKKLAEKLKINKEAKDFVQFKLDKIVIISDNVIKDLKEKAEQLKSMLTLQSKLTYVNQSLQEIKAKERIIPDLKLDNLTKQAKRLDELKSLNSKLVINKDEQEKIAFLNVKIKIPKVDFDTLKEDNLMLTELIKLRNKLIDNKKGQEKITLQLEFTDKNRVILEKELKEIWDKNPTCPLCGQNVGK